VSPRERVRRLVDGELGAAEEAALLAEAERDEGLAAALEEARWARDALADLEPEGPPEPPADLVDRAVLRAVQRRAAEEDAPAWQRWARRLTRPIVVRLRLTPTSVLVGAAAVALLGVYAYRTVQQPATVAAPTVTDGASEIATPEPARDADVARSDDDEDESVFEVAVRLMLPTEGADSVAVAGDFNDWATDSTFLEDPEGDGVFVGTLRLPPGSYSYMFVVDGERWVSDPYAVNHRDDGFGNRNAVLRID
jgi:hypothetical protein